VRGQRDVVLCDVNYKKGCTRLAAASDQVYQLLAQGRWFSPTSSTTKTGRNDIAEILLKVALNTKIQIQILISWQSVLLVEETGENHRPAAKN
jgi:hypothetical protein